MISYHSVESTSKHHPMSAAGSHPSPGLTRLRNVFASKAILHACEIGALAAVILWTDFLHFYIFNRSYISEYVLSSNLPLKLSGIEPWLAGQFPIWNSRLAAGWPVLADAASLPLDWRNFLYFIFDPVPAYWASLFAGRIAGTALLFYYLRLRHGIRFAAALPATFVYFCGTLVMEDSRQPWAVVWDLLPAYLWAVERLYERLTAARGVTIAILWFFMFTMGTFGRAIYIAPIGGLWSFALFLVGPKRDWARFARFTAAFFGAHALGMALTGVTLVPFIEFVFHSNRGDEYPTDPFAMRGFFFLLFGAHDQENALFPTFNFFLYIGVTALPLLLMAWRERDSAYQRALPWLSLFVLSVILLLTTPLKSFLREYLPFIATTGGAGFAPFWGFLAALAVAFALNADAWRPARWVRIATACLLALQGAVLIGIVFLWTLSLVLTVEDPERLPDLQAAFLSLAPLAAPAAVVLISIRVLGLGLAVQGGSATKLHAIGAMLLLELTATMAIARPSTPQSAAYPVTPEVAYLKEHLDTLRSRMMMVYPFFARDLDSYITLFFDAQSYHRLNSANIYNSLIVKEYADVIADFGDLDERKRLFRRGYSQNMVTNRATSPLMDALAVRFVVAAVPLTYPEPLIERLQGVNYIVYERPDPMPRAFFVSHAEVLDADAIHARLQKIARAEFTFQQLRRYVLLDKDSAPPGLTVKTPKPAPQRNEQFVPARVREDAHARVVVDVDAPSDGWLVLSDTFYPGWRATADGRSVPIVRANGFARAVPVHAGRQEVIFQYRPKSLVYGIALSVIALIVTVGLVANPLMHPRAFSRPMLSGRF
jgi:hypothetical protein